MRALLQVILLAGVTTPGARLACYERARQQTQLGPQAAIRLCRDAGDAQPLACYRKARTQTDLDEPEAIALCRCAPSTQPVTCYEGARRQTELDRAAAVRLCQPAVAAELAPRCGSIVRAR